MDIPPGTHTRTQTRAALLRCSRTWDDAMAGIGDARDAVAALLAEVRPVPPRRSVQDARLVASELVTNVAKHAPGPCTLSLEVLPGAGALRIAVSDTSPDPPLMRPPDPRRVGGHGLHLVAMLSRALEVARLPHGKRITATVPLAAEPE
ncbi:ATP-binding protein [Streptomyces sp. NPDC059680]|uniref:ATP-binding protein n=1 Tax=Streptomyces sp. NPDC059680 TaxID=3346904 RepID=UPI00367659D8